MQIFSRVTPSLRYYKKDNLNWVIFSEDNLGPLCENANCFANSHELVEGPRFAHLLLALYTSAG